MAIRTPESQTGSSNEEPPKLYVPEQSSGEVFSRTPDKDAVKDEAEKRNEERMKNEEDGQSVKGYRPGGSASGEILNFGTPESSPSIAPKIITGLEQQPKPETPVVSGDKPGLVLPENYDQTKSGASGPVNIAERQREYNALKEEEQRKEAEAKITGHAVIPQEKGKSMEGAVIRTGEQQEQDRIKAEPRLKKVWKID